MADITKEQVIEFVKQMSVLELAEMVKELEEVFGVSAAAPVAVAAAGPAAGEAAAVDRAWSVRLPYRSAGRRIESWDVGWDHTNPLYPRRP